MKLTVLFYYSGLMRGGGKKKNSDICLSPAAKLVFRIQ